MASSNAVFSAGGTIDPSTFVKINTGSDHTVLAAGAGGAAIGISQAGTRRAPYGSLDDTHAALVDEQLTVFQEGEICQLKLGGTVTRGDRLKSDASSFGVVAATTDPSYAKALESGVANQFIQVVVMSMGIIAAA